MDLYVPDESPSDTGNDTCDYEAMTSHAFRQTEHVKCDSDTMNHHADPHNCDPIYMKKKKPSNMMI